MGIMYGTVARELGIARRLFGAYLRNGDYANAERVLDCARDDLGDARAYVDASDLLRTFIAPDSKFARRMKALDTAQNFVKSIKAYEKLGDWQNASLTKKRLGTYLANRAVSAEYVRRCFNGELEKMLEASRHDDIEGARGHYGISRFYARKGAIEIDDKTAGGLTRLGENFERFDMLERFREETEKEITERQPPVIELPRNMAERLQHLKKRFSFIGFLEKKKEQLRGMFKH